MTLVERPSSPVTLCPTDQMYGAIQNNDDLKSTCRCTDSEVHRLIDLVAGGMDQFAASRLLWGSADARPLGLLEEISREEAAPGERVCPPVVVGSERADHGGSESSSPEPTHRADFSWSSLLERWWRR